MSLRFYNSLSRKLEEFIPQEKGIVKIYSCGPTVYNYAHIGNLRAFIFSDLLKRYLSFRGYDVQHVMNVTDVDDKTIRDSQVAGKSLKEFTDYYYTEFLHDLDTLNIQKAPVMPRATEEIEGMVTLISELIEKGFAYRTDSGDVYFKVDSFPDYGELVQLDKQKLRDNADGRLNSSDEYEKEDAQDFALWKAHSDEDGDVFWETSLGKGRPGWHIECSVMSTKYLGQHFDIHTGGVDLKFPHHTNEIAQSECLGHGKLAEVWLHNEHLMVNGKKMSKSEGNFYTLRDLLDKDYDSRAIRYELIKTHYRQQLDFREENIASNLKVVERLQEFSERLTSISEFGEGIKEWERWKADIILQFIEAMDNDLNISGGLAVLFEFMKGVNKDFDNLSEKQAIEAHEVLTKFDSVIGVLREPQEELLAEDIEALIQEREAARKGKDFARADEIRDQLLSQGIELKDTSDGVKWKKR